MFADQGLSGPAAQGQPGTSDRYVVIGHPVAHSRSPQIHARFAQQTGEQIHYDRLQAPLEGFVQTVREFIATGGRGANVTVPFKREAFALADQLTPRAYAAGAVNTLSFLPNGILGDNTDGVGLVRDIEVNASFPLKGKSVLLLGAGGAARGVILPLLEAGVAHLVMANRTLSRAQALVAELGDSLPLTGQLQACAFDVPTDRFDLVINATSASLQSDLPPVSARVLSPSTLAYDMMYGAAPTVFLAWASGHGAQVRDGLGMLVEQAAEAFWVWRGVRPQTAPVLDWLRSQL